MKYINIQGLIRKNNKRKLNYLSECCNYENVHLMFITESHLNSEILDEEVNIPDFTVHRCDRTDRIQGGVAMYVKDTMKAQNITKFSNSVCELLMCYIEELNLNAICVYRPPDTISEEFNPCLSEIRNYLQKVPASQNIILLGDLNFPFLKWSETDDTVVHHIISGSLLDEQAQAQSFIDLTDQYFLNQVITDPTRK